MTTDTRKCRHLSAACNGCEESSPEGEEMKYDAILKLVQSIDIIDSSLMTWVLYLTQITGRNALIILIAHVCNNVLKTFTIIIISMLLFESN